MKKRVFKRPKVIAEIGCNHKGDFDIAKELIRIAKDCGASVAKFQKRNPKTLLSEQQYNSPHLFPHNSYGSSYGEHRDFLEFSQEQHSELKKYCESKSIIYATSVWDVVSAKEIVELNPLYIKVPSAQNTNFKLLQILRDDYKGDVHVSLGMTSRKEEGELVEFFQKTGDAKDRLILYSCTSGYPVPFEDINLLEIERLRNSYNALVKDIGFSGHHLGISADIAAYTLDCGWIERHFTKDRTWRGTDHAASFEPQGLKKLIRDLNAVHKALKYKKKEILDVEMPQRKKLKYAK